MLSEEKCCLNSLPRISQFILMSVIVSTQNNGSDLTLLFLSLVFKLFIMQAFETAGSKTNAIINRYRESKNTVKIMK